MSTLVSPKIIGLAGTFAGGKDTLATYLVEHYGYIHISTSDMVRQEAMARFESIERPILFKTATEVRYNEGAGAFVLRALDQAGGNPVIISGLRSIGERDEIKRRGGVVIFVDAPVKVRYERMKARLRDAEVQLTFDEFNAGEQKEWHAGDNPADFNLRDIKSDADVVFENVLPLDQFLKTVVASLGVQA